MDDDCHLEHKRISDALDEVARDLEWHSAEQHSQLMPRAEAKSAIEETKRLAANNAANVSKILDEILGPIHPLSAERRIEHGLSHKVDTIWRQSQNGGVQAKLTPREKAAIWTAAIGGMVAIVTALINVIA